MTRLRLDRIVRALGLLFAALLCTPAIARACPVCFAARDEAERVALIGTTVLLTSMPVVMIGALIYWIARRSRELDEEQATRAPEGHDTDSSTLRDGNRPATQAEVIPLHRA